MAKKRGRPRQKPESEIARKLRAIAAAEGYDNDQLAEAFGITAHTLRSWLYERRNPTGPARKLLDILYEKAKKKGR